MAIWNKTLTSSGTFEKRNLNSCLLWTCFCKYALDKPFKPAQSLVLWRYRFSLYPIIFKMIANPLYQKIFFFNHYFSSIFCFLAKLLMLLGALLLRFVGNCWYLLLMLLLQLMLYITTQNIEFYCDCNTNTITQSFCFNFFGIFGLFFFSFSWWEFHVTSYEFRVIL